MVEIYRFVTDDGEEVLHQTVEVRLQGGVGSPANRPDGQDRDLLSLPVRPLQPGLDQLLQQPPLRTAGGHDNLIA